ncbi:hypothetical protein LIER_17960 [Lithospermum erythrorhizon]|uniref:DOG1 domain-containing protein n=1 Tax=Lithospermum erythrorhizon TaxID=34254 RepID=A0AAV3QC80_LITER
MDNNSNNFSSFIEDWFHRQSTFLYELNRAEESSRNSEETEIRSLVDRVLAHYQQYFEEKSRMAHRNVFIMFSPPWFTPLEKALLWIAGFKPGMAFTLLETSVNDLSRNQRQRINELKNEVKFQERELYGQYARIQETVAAPPLAELARGSSLAMQMNNNRRVDSVLEPLSVEMENLLSEADSLRITTAESVVEILTPLQKVRYLAAAAELQIGVRSMGLQRQDAENGGW